VGLEQLSNVLNDFQKFLHPAISGLDSTLITMGFLILVLLIFGGIVYGLFKLARAIPGMTARQLFLFTVILAGALILIGVII
jgi:hypothetical protein